MGRSTLRRAGAAAGAMLIATVVLTGSGPTAGAERRSTSVPVRFVARTDPLVRIARRAVTAPVVEPRAEDARALAAPQLPDTQESEPASVHPSRRAVAEIALPSGAVPVVLDGSRASWQGTNHFDTRYADGGNQLTATPPDQGLCVADRYVTEVVNSDMQVYRKSGRPLLGGTSAYPGGPPVGIAMSELELPRRRTRTMVAADAWIFTISGLSEGVHRLVVRQLVYGNAAKATFRITIT